MSERALSTRALNCIKLAIRDGHIESADQIRDMSDKQVRFRVRGNGQSQAIGKVLLAEVRKAYPQN